MFFQSVVLSQAELNALVNSSRVVVFGDDGAETTAAKALMEDKRKLSPKLVQLDSGEESGKLKEQLKELTGQVNLPVVFVNGMHLGEFGQGVIWERLCNCWKFVR